MTLAWRRDSLEPEIDRHGMAQIAQMCEPHAGQGVAFQRPGRGQAGKIAVRKGEHQDVSRWLAQIDGLDDLVEASGAGCEQMHCSNAQ